MIPPRPTNHRRRSREAVEPIAGHEGVAEIRSARSVNDAAPSSRKHVPIHDALIGWIVCKNMRWLQRTRHPCRAEVGIVGDDLVEQSTVHPDGIVVRATDVVIRYCGDAVCRFVSVL